MRYLPSATARAREALVLAAIAHGVSACSSDSTEIIARMEETSMLQPSEPGSVYVLSTLLFGDEGTTGYVSVLDSLGPQTIDNTEAREFAGAADVWVHEGAVFVTNDEAFTITKFSVEAGA